VVCMKMFYFFGRNHAQTGKKTFSRSPQQGQISSELNDEEKNSPKNIE
jgi:hypothetical protein